MNKIMSKSRLNDTVSKIDIYAPLIAKKAKAGQFIILRVDAEGERIPLTINDCDIEKGTVSIVYQIVGATTKKLDKLEVNDYINDFVGPLGKPTEILQNKKIAVIGGGVGCAIAYPVAKAFYNNGCEVHTIIGFRNKDLVIFSKEFEKVSDKCVLVTDDGSAGTKGLVTEALKALVEDGHTYDEIVVIGPLVMMKFVCLLTKQYGIKTTVSMNPIMIDGTGMCGGCRLTVGGTTKFACVDGPDFDGHQVDFDEVIARNKRFANFENEKREEECNLFKGV